MPAAASSRSTAAGLKKGISTFSGSGYPQRSRPGTPIPLAPEVAQLLAATPEAAPALAAAAGYPASQPARSLPVASQSVHADLGPPATGGRSANPSSPTASPSASGGRPPRPEALCRGGVITGTSLSASSSSGRRHATRPAAPCIGALPVSASIPRSRPGQAQEPELTEAEVLRAVDGDGTLADVVQLHYRKRGLQSLRTPATVDFSELVSLRILSLSHNSLSDITPVGDLPALVELNVTQNCIQDLRPAFACEGLEVLLASGNRVASLSGIEAASRLQRLSLFSNEVVDVGEFVPLLEGLADLRFLDVAGNPCMEDASHRYTLIRALPRLKEIDGEVLRPVDKELANAFFETAGELGYQERPRTAPRPQTAPAPSAVRDPVLRLPAGGLRSPSPLRRISSGDLGLCSAELKHFGRGEVAGGELSPSRSVRASSRGRAPSRGLEHSASGSRMPSASPSPSPDESERSAAPGLAAPEVDPSDPMGTIQRYAAHVEALRLRTQTVQVECENLRREIREIREQEPVMGVATWRVRLTELEAENARMHSRVAENKQLRTRLEAKEADLAEKRRAAGLPELRPRTSAGRPGSSTGRSRLAALNATGSSGSNTSRPGTAIAAVEAVLEVSQAWGCATEASQLRARNRALREEIANLMENMGRLQHDACDAALGRPMTGGLGMALTVGT